MKAEIDRQWSGKRVILMARQSDDGEGNDSVRAQIEWLKVECARQGMIYVDEVVLEGITGSVPGLRKDIVGLMERKREHDDFDIVAVQRFDRLTRSGAVHGFWVTHEFATVGVQIYVADDNVPKGPWSSLIQTAKYESARDQARSISQRSTQGKGLALAEGRNAPFSHTPYGCDRLYCSSQEEPMFIMRNRPDGRQDKIDPQTYEVIDTLGRAGTKYGHYRKQLDEKVTLIPGQGVEARIVRDILIEHWRHKLGASVIADRLNRQGIPSPWGKKWSKRSVEVVYENTCYAGLAFCNTSSSAIFYERTEGSRPKTASTTEADLAQGKPPVRLRPPEEWVEVELPYMQDFLPADVRERLLVEMKEAKTLRYERSAKRTTRKRSNSRHKNSPYLLTGKLQDTHGELLSGVLIGRTGKQQRRYRHKRGQREYLVGNAYTKTLNAEVIEEAVVKVLVESLQDEQLIRAVVMQAVQQPEEARAVVDVESLRRRRREVQKKIDQAFDMFDGDALKAIKPRIEALSMELRQIDTELAQIERSSKQLTLDPETLVKRVIDRLRSLSGQLDRAPIPQLRSLIDACLEKVVVDMPTQKIEVLLRIPYASAVCLVDSSSSPTVHQTHQPPAPEGYLRLAESDCLYVKPGRYRMATCECQRRPRCAA